MHVASVLQMTHMLLTHGGIRRSNAMDWLEVYCAYWSAITHDFEHGGVNNDFLVNANHQASRVFWPRPYGRQCCIQSGQSCVYRCGHQLHVSTASVVYCFCGLLLCVVNCPCGLLVLCLTALVSAAPVVYGFMLSVAYCCLLLPTASGGCVVLQLWSTASC